MTLSVRLNNFNIKVPILHGTSIDNCIIPPRCEVFRIFKLRGITEPMFVDSHEVCDGVFISKCIIDSNTPILRIVNITDEVKCINNFDIKSEYLANYKVYSIDKVKPSNQRIENLRNLLKNQMPNEVMDDLMPLCLQYNDIFALKDDKMTVNNFYEQKLRLNDDSPVYNKNYRWMWCSFKSKFRWK